MIVTYRNFQYHKELELYNQLKPVFDQLKSKNEEIERQIGASKQNFFNLLSSSIKVDKLAEVENLIQSINTHFKSNLKVDIFINQSANSNAVCMPHFDLNEEGKNLIIIVSQHFFNNLSKEEQLAIIGHELGHLLFGHIKIPINIILQEKFQLKEIQTLKKDVLKWSICCEISCDILGFIACGFKKDTFSTALLKYYTAIDKQIFKDLNEKSFIDLVLNQFDSIANSSCDGLLSTHPLTPLRLKIINSIADTRLIKNYGKDLSDIEYKEYYGEFNKIINEHLRLIYPEIISKSSNNLNKILLPMAFAIAISNQKIDRVEIECIGKILNLDINSVISQYQKIEKQLKTESFETCMTKLINEAIVETKKLALHKSEILSILRQLLIVAASDSKVEECELQILFLYARENHISPPEIFLLINQLGIR